MAEEDTVEGNVAAAVTESDNPPKLPVMLIDYNIPEEEAAAEYHGRKDADSDREAAVEAVADDPRNCCMHHKMGAEYRHDNSLDIDPVADGKPEAAEVAASHDAEESAEAWLPYSATVAVAAYAAADSENREMPD